MLSTSTIPQANNFQNDFVSPNNKNSMRNLAENFCEIDHDHLKIT